MTENNIAAGLPTIGGHEGTPESASSGPAPYQLRRVQGGRAGLTVSMSDGVAEVVEREGRPAPAATPSWSKEPIRFFSEHGGSQITSRQASMHDTVDLGGMIGRTSIGAALHNGWLVENESGGYERAGEARAPTAPAPRRQQQDALEPDHQEPRAAEQQPQQRAPKPQPSYLRHEDEAAYREAEQIVGSTTFAAIENIMTDPDFDDIPENLLGNVARSLGTDLDGARAAIAQTAAPMVAQASAHIEAMVGDGNADAVLEWARSDRQGRVLLRDAMRGQVDSRDLSGYREVVAGFLAHQAKVDPHGVAQGLIAGGSKAKVQDGKVLVDLGKAGGGWTEFVTAVRGGVIRLGR